jgi:hypothetical protein
VQDPPIEPRGIQFALNPADDPLIYPTRRVAWRLHHGSVQREKQRQPEYWREYPPEEDCVSERLRDARHLEWSLGAGDSQFVG